MSSSVERGSVATKQAATTIGSYVAAIVHALEARGVSSREVLRSAGIDHVFRRVSAHRAAITSVDAKCITFRCVIRAGQVPSPPPAVHVRVPRVHGLPVSHAEPLVHSVQPSGLHTPLPVGPHEVPTGRSSVATQTAVPEPQSISPRVQGSPVSHTTP